MAKKESLEGVDFKEVNEQDLQDLIQTDAETVKEISAADAKAFSEEEMKTVFDKHEKLANDFGRLLQRKGYQVKFDGIKDAKSLLKHLEKNVKWTHADAPLFIAVYQKLKEAVEKGLNEESELALDGPALNSLYQLLLKSEGTGYIEVREYISLLTSVGEGISNGMRKLAEDQNLLKLIHTNLSIMDSEMTARQQGIQVEDLAEDQA
jgi:hypothetical protein